MCHVHRICNHYGPCHCCHQCGCHHHWWPTPPTPIIVAPAPIIVRPRPLRERLNTETRLAIKALAGQKG